MAHYFTNEDLKSNVQKFHTKVLSEEFSFYTENGVFSKEKMDFGTRVLLEVVLSSNDICGKVLDVGCGYGPIGIIVAKLTGASVTMCDVNKRALHLANRNAKENRVDVNILESDCYLNISDNDYDFIFTNPPIRAGKQKVYEILMDASKYLKPGGKLFLVVHKDQGAKSIFSDLAKYYNDVSILDKNKGFFIISCKKP